jgi:hypothetical protein
MDPCIVDYSVEIPTRYSFVIEFIVPQFVKCSTCFERHTAYHQELWQSSVTIWAYKPEAANTVYCSWRWTVCRSKHVEPLKNFGIINSLTKLHLVGISTEHHNSISTIIRLIQNKQIRRFIPEGQIIETILTNAPAVILVFITIPSLRLIYLIDEIFENMYVHNRKFSIRIDPLTL